MHRLCEQFPDVYSTATQLRTLQRRVQLWRNEQECCRERTIRLTALSSPLEHRGHRRAFRTQPNERSGFLAQATTYLCHDAERCRTRLRLGNNRNSSELMSKRENKAAAVEFRELFELGFDRKQPVFMRTDLRKMGEYKWLSWMK
jgi:hypothetical protein